MSTTVRLTYDQFEERVRQGDLADIEERIELISGELHYMPAPDPPHDFATDVLAAWSFDHAPRPTVWIRVQGSLGIPALDSVPVPDLLWLHRRDYSKTRPSPADVYLIVEVSDSTLSFDRGQKAKLYAQAGLVDYWIVNIRKRGLEIRRAPEKGGYRTLLTLRPGDEARPLASPDVALQVEALFPQK